MWREGGVLQKMMDDAESEEYVRFPLDYYELCQNTTQFTVKTMIFIKKTLSLFLLLLLLVIKKY